MPANISPYFLLILLILILILILLPAFSPRAYACAYVCIRVYIYIKKSHLRRVDERGGGLPSCTDTLLFTLLLLHPRPSLLRFARTVIILPIPFSTYSLHASIVQTDDGNYLRFSANAINQKRRSASPPGPLDRQGYPPPLPAPSVSLAPPLAFDSTRLRRLIIHD